MLTLMKQLPIQKLLTSKNVKNTIMINLKSSFVHNVGMLVLCEILPISLEEGDCSCGGVIENIASAK